MDISGIARDFRAGVNFAVDGEVDLFRVFASVIEARSSSIFVDETHGSTKCNVSFSLTNGNVTRCEIADLLIVCRSSDSPYLRATFWQAKKQKASKWISMASSDMHVDFSGQFNQWDLLSRRPEISGVAPFTPPSHLLSCFQSPSIGSFGIFFERSSTVEVMYAIAEFVGCVNPKAKFPALFANAFLAKYKIYGEAILRPDLESFLAALFGFEVGAILLPSEAAHQWLVAYVKTKIASSSRSVSRGFFSAYDSLPRLDIEPAGDGMSLLVIDGSDAS